MGPFLLPAARRLWYNKATKHRRDAYEDHMVRTFLLSGGDGVRLSDHNYRQGAALSGRETKLRVRKLETFHDGKKGALRGPNTIHVLEAEGLRLAHLGDLGHMLSEEQIAALERVDIMLIPEGGYFTIGPYTAAELAEKLRPAITVPMHYRGEGFGYEVIGPVEDFLRRRDKVLRLETNVLRPETLETPVTAVLKVSEK